MIDILLLASDHLKALFPAYAITIIILLIFSRGIVFLKTRRTTLLIAANIAACLTGSLLSLVWITELICHYNNPEDIDHMFFRYRMSAYIIPLLLVSSASILPLFYKLRRSIVATFIMIILLNTPTRIESILYFITSFNRDYLPSSWSYRPAAWYESPLWALLYTGVFLLLTYLVFILRQRHTRTTQD